MPDPSCPGTALRKALKPFCLIINLWDVFLYPTGGTDASAADRNDHTYYPVVLPQGSRGSVWC